jgi:hypothetical protein
MLCPSGCPRTDPVLSALLRTSAHPAEFTDDGLERIAGAWPIVAAGPSSESPTER